MDIFLYFFFFYSEHIEQETRKRILETEYKILKYFDRKYNWQM
jgi:hypothetical protein